MSDLRCVCLLSTFVVVSTVPVSVLLPRSRCCSVWRASAVACSVRLYRASAGPRLRHCSGGLQRCRDCCLRSGTPDTRTHLRSVVLPLTPCAGILAGIVLLRTGASKVVTAPVGRSRRCTVSRSHSSGQHCSTGPGTGTVTSGPDRSKSGSRTHWDVCQPESRQSARQRTVRPGVSNPRVFRYVIRRSVFTVRTARPVQYGTPAITRFVTESPQVEIRTRDHQAYGQHSTRERRRHPRGNTGRRGCRTRGSNGGARGLGRGSTDNA